MYGYLLVFIGDTEILLCVVIHEFLTGDSVIDSLSGDAIDKLLFDIFWFFPSGQYVGMLAHIIGADQCLQGDIVGVAGIEFVISCAYERGHFWGDRVLDVL